MFTKVDGTVDQATVGLSEDTKQESSPVSQKISIRFFAHKRERSISFPFITKKVDGADEGKPAEQSQDSQLIKFLKEKDSKNFDIVDFGTPILRRSENKKSDVSKLPERQQSEMSTQPDNDITQAEYESPRP
jgi:hypothetical protein